MHTTHATITHDGPRTNVSRSLNSCSESRVGKEEKIGLKEIIGVRLPVWSTKDFWYMYSELYGMVWYGMVWYGMVWYGMVRYGMVWYVQ